MCFVHFKSLETYTPSNLNVDTPRICLIGHFIKNVSTHTHTQLIALPRPLKWMVMKETGLYSKVCRDCWHVAATLFRSVYGYSCILCWSLLPYQVFYMIHCPASKPVTRFPRMLKTLSSLFVVCWCCSDCFLVLGLPQLWALWSIMSDTYFLTSWCFVLLCHYISVYQ